MNVNRQVCNVTINESADGQRLDNFLFKTLKNVPKSHVYQIIRNGEVRVNKKRAKAQNRLTIGDSVRIPPIFLSNSNFEQKQSAPLPKIQIPVLYEDDCLLVVDKPAGLAVHGGSGLNFGIIEILRSFKTFTRNFQNQNLRKTLFCWRFWCFKKSFKNQFATFQNNLAQWRALCARGF